MNQAEVNELLQFALDAVWQAGRITLGYFQTGVKAERKADNTPLTIADQLAEQKLRELIAARFPDHGMVGEEYGRTPSDSPYTWIIDPIDGTKSFVSGVPIYANLLALLDGEKALLGVINFPALNEMVYAVRGGGCYWNGRRCHTSATASLADAVLLASDLNSFGPRQPQWQRLIQATYIQRTWGDAYGYALVATGRADVMIDPIMALWDTAPLQVILEEADGTFTDWQGTPTIHHNESVATNGKLLSQVLALLK
ncbi:MAG: inositol monophosphatase family protein [Chloroflexi bacterium]|nr:inositol monophosphatase family protein [Ardenticatenaceae bacterium]MBL1131146.1 inositol monophosphatase family protein [Chloroflexota bacterium]NOG37245.1 inositol monophosphatase family protein [Chloroflexota bacterium]